MYIVQAEGKFITRVSPKDELVKERHKALLLTSEAAYRTAARLQSAGKRRVVVIQAQPVVTSAADANELEAGA